jgi:hypothetical protein
MTYFYTESTGEHLMYNWKERLADAAHGTLNVLCYILIFLFFAAPIVARGMMHH